MQYPWKNWAMQKISEVIWEGEVMYLEVSIPHFKVIISSLK